MLSKISAIWIACAANVLHYLYSFLLTVLKPISFQCIPVSHFMHLGPESAKYIVKLCHLLFLLICRLTKLFFPKFVNPVY